MTEAFQVNSDGDMVRVNGRFVRVDSTAQRLQTRLRYIRGEWFLNRENGVPYFERILGKGRNVSHIRQVLAAEIKAVEGVTSLDEIRLELDRATRALSVSFRVNGGDRTTITLSAI